MYTDIEGQTLCQSLQVRPGGHKDTPLRLTLFHRICESNKVWKSLLNAVIDVLMINRFRRMNEIIPQIDQIFEPIGQRTRKQLLSSDDAEYFMISFGST
jgi:hypothetical protein